MGFCPSSLPLGSQSQLCSLATVVFLLLAMLLPLAVVAGFPICCLV